MDLIAKIFETKKELEEKMNKVSKENDQLKLHIKYKPCIVENVDGSTVCN